VQIRIGYDLFQPAASPRLTVKIERANGEYRATGELRSEPGSVAFASTFTEVECGAAIRSLAIAVAIHFTRGPEACSLSPLPAQTPTPIAVPVAPIAPVAPVTPVTPEPQRPPGLPAPLPERPRVQIGMMSAFSLGSAPVVVGGAAWLVGARWAGFSSALEGRALFASTARLVGPRVQRGYRFLVAAVAASGCVHPAWAFACFQIEWRSLSIGNATVDVDPDHLSRLGLGFRFGGERALTQTVALRAFVETSFNPGSRSLRTPTASSAVVWHEPILSISLGFGPVVTF
jgi:hypothetical protein